MDVGEYLAKASEKEYGGPLRFIGGEVRFEHFYRKRRHATFQTKVKGFNDMTDDIKLCSLLALTYLLL
jgi:hypothetical protein